MTPPLHVAVDLGAGSGRVLVGGFDDGTVALEEVHRFSYAPRPAAGRLRWNVDRLLDGMRLGLRRAAALAARDRGRLRSIGVDSWGVDYGLVNAAGELVEEPICYRDPRTDGMLDRAFSRLGREALFCRTGIQCLPFNTLFQLMAHAEAGLPPGAARLLMIPDLCHQSLCGSSSGEITNASTTGLLNLETADWDDVLFTELGLPRQLMPPLRPPGSELGTLGTDLQKQLYMLAVPVVQPATHDTASAVAGSPLTPGSAYISSGTWSLVGVERSTPLADASVLAANFTNERGVCGTFRFLKNVAGLWILERCRREWEEAGADARLDHLVAGAAALARSPGLIYPDAPRFFNPPRMVEEVRAALGESGYAASSDPVELTRIILDSLACRYASVLRTIEALTGDRIEAVHIVGGGSRNAYLNQATANAAGRLVLAGPVEATGLGNILVQAVACGVTTVADGRKGIARTFAPRRFEPVNGHQWTDMSERYEAVEREAINAAA